MNPVDFAHHNAIPSSGNQTICPKSGSFFENPTLGMHDPGRCTGSDFGRGDIHRGELQQHRRKFSSELCRDNRNKRT